MAIIWAFQSYFLLFLTFVNGQKICSIDINYDIDDYTPLILIKGENAQWNYIIPKNQSQIVVQGDEEILLSCQSNNRLSIGNQPSEGVATCFANNVFNFHGQIYPLKKLKCQNPVHVMAKLTSKRCFNDGKIITFFYKVPPENELEFMEICFNEEKHFTYYSKHWLLSQFSRMKKKHKPSFSVAVKELYTRKDPNNAYVYRYQRIAFIDQLGPGYTDKLLNKAAGNFFNRGHLTPSLDNSLTMQMFHTYFYENVSPQWSRYNSGNWGLLETQLTKYSQHGSLLIYTGTMGRLVLTGSNGPVEMSLLNPNIPIPLYFWKFVYDPRTESCAGFITTNDPTLIVPPKELCPNACSEFHWPTFNNDIKAGYTYCCKFSSFSKVVQNFSNYKSKCINEFKWQN